MTLATDLLNPDLERALRDCPGLQLVVLFGSVARERARPDSDVDIGFLGGDFWDQLAIGSEISRRLRREPHVVDLGTASDWLRFEVAHGGALFHERQPGNWARFQAESMLRYFDLQPIIQICAEGVRRRLAREAGKDQRG